MAIWDDIKQRYTAGTLLTRLIYINVGVFVVLRLLAFVGLLLGFDASRVIAQVELPSSPVELLHRPWALLTYMVSHYNVLHILFNMLWLYWLGRIFLEYFTPKQLGALYLLGGLGGAIFFVAGYSLLPVLSGQSSLLIGASASVLAIVVAMAVYAPDYPIGLLLIGQISLKWLAIITVAITFLGVDSSQIGTQLAHLGGIGVGALYGMQMRKGHDITAWLNRAIDAVVTFFKGVGQRRKPGVGAPVGGKAFRQGSEKSAAASPAGSRPTEAEVDAILDKLKRSGYGALTDEERATLFNASKK